MKSNSSSDDSTATSHKKYWQYPCSHCPLTFKSGQALGGHQQVHRMSKKIMKATRANENQPVVGSSSQVNVQPPFVEFAPGLADAPIGGIGFNDHGPAPGFQPGSGEHGQRFMTCQGDDHLQIEFLDGSYHYQFYPEAAHEDSTPNLAMDFFKEWALLENFGGGEPLKTSSERTLTDPNVRALDGVKDGVEVSSKEEVVDLELKLGF